MSDLSFDQLARDSVFARVDVRAKLALVGGATCITLLWDRPLLQLLLATFVLILCVIGGVSYRYLISMFRVMFPFYVILILTHGFFNVQYVKSLTGRAALTPLFQLPAAWWLVGGGTMTHEGFWFGINAILKTVTLTLLAPLFIFTTSVDSLIAGLVQARVPYKIAFIISATLRFFPMLFVDVRSIIDAQRMRGLAVEKMNMLGRIRVYARVAVPLILGAMAKSQQLEVVLQSKAFSGSAQRTYLHDARLRATDYLIMVLSMGTLLFVIALYARAGVGKFAGGL